MRCRAAPPTSEVERPLHVSRTAALGTEHSFADEGSGRSVVLASQRRQTARHHSFNLARANGGSGRKVSRRGTAPSDRSLMDDNHSSTRNDHSSAPALPKAQSRCVTWRACAAITTTRCANCSTAPQSVNSTHAIGSVGPLVSHMMRRMTSRSMAP